ncbi:MAG: hypothetical protein OTJ97_03620 [SAR202 cluster bacterium]|nr:hypothetical protein [SAR202 cluster bacterium]
MGGLTACRLLDSSLNLHDLRDCLGHAHITTTSRYVRTTPVRLAQALERMEAATETLVDADDSLRLGAFVYRSRLFVLAQTEGEATAAVAPSPSAIRRNTP